MPYTISRHVTALSRSISRKSRKQRWFADDSGRCNISLNYIATRPRGAREEETKKRTGSRCPKRNHGVDPARSREPREEKRSCCKLIRKLGCSHRRASRFAGRVGVQHTTLSSHAHREIEHVIRD
ncbi:hypothetical protein QLX08_006486 [Tetragonisca angustula]|uniref:Transposase n=1 Tax=Tetragonisca angustula TaxID=166442 RepID=A0AAW0ZT84_9HYME